MDDKNDKNNEYIEVMYNDCYGGFRFSKLALDEYNKNCIFESNGFDIDRNDPIMIGLCKQLGPAVNGPHTKIKIQMIPKIYQHYYDIDEYDGKETIVIDYTTYKLDTIKNIMTLEISNEEKLKRIDKILNN